MSVLKSDVELPSLAVVETPFQLLNCIEALARFNLLSCHLLLLPYAFPESAFTALLGHYRWESVRAFTIHDSVNGDGTGPRPLVSDLALTMKQLRRRRAYDHLLAGYGPVDRLFLGNYLDGYKYYIRHVHNVMPHREVVLVDDGTDVLLVAEQLRQGVGRRAEDAERSRSIIGRYRGHLRRRHVDWDGTAAARLTFFTAFDIRARPQDRIVRNNYGALRSVLAGRPVQPYAVFIGQCLPEVGDMTLDAYSEYLGRALTHIPAERTLYVPHPRQSADVIDRLRRDHGLDMLRPPLPFELHMATTGEVPSHIASFFSSALETCSRILEGTAQVAAYRLPSELLLHNRETTELFYQHFVSRVRHGFTVVDL